MPHTSNHSQHKINIKLSQIITALFTIRSVEKIVSNCMQTHVKIFETTAKPRIYMTHHV